MVGNIYFVGTKEASSHLIDTGDGLILIDTGYEETAEAILESMEILGFKPENVKYILHSHGHGDHSYGTPLMLKHAPNAKTYLSFKDIKYIKGFTPDVDITDKTTLKLGNTEIKMLFTPGHTEGSVSFFFDVCEGGKTYRAAMFGGAGVGQLKREYMIRRDVPFLCRGYFLDSIERLLGVECDITLGNHTWHNKTLEKYERLGGEKNPFIVSGEWKRFLNAQRNAYYRVQDADRIESFINFAHRGASEYFPENTIEAFEAGLAMGANGIETDVYLTRDGIPVLFHDSTLTRMCGADGAIGDYTYDELCKLDVRLGDKTGKIPTLDEFLARFGGEEITLAIELKGEGTEIPVADMIEKYGIRKKCVITSFDIEKLKKIKEYSPLLRIGHLTSDYSDEHIKELCDIGADEICPRGRDITPELVARLKRVGFNVRAWGIADCEIMKNAYDAGTHGMTVNFPDLLTKYIKETEDSHES